jgi:hypothetical protein
MEIKLRPSGTSFCNRQIWKVKKFDFKIETRRERDLSSKKIAKVMNLFYVLLHASVTPNPSSFFRIWKQNLEWINIDH